MHSLHSTSPEIGTGIYTIADAARILRLDGSKLRRWAKNYWTCKHSPDSELVRPAEVWYHKSHSAIGFHTMIELFTISALRDLGVSLHTVRKARDEMVNRLRLSFPLAHKGLLSDGKKLLFELKEADSRIALELDMSGQTAFLDIVEPFCTRIEFSQETQLAERYWPLGREKSVVVDPHHSFGQPVIDGTNTTTQALFELYQSGESFEDLAGLYDIPATSVGDAVFFEGRTCA